MIENLELIGTGFAVVMSVLASIWAACALIGSFFIRADRAAAAKAAALAVPAPVAAASGVPPQHLAAITAAAYQMLGPGYVITRVDAPSHMIAEWPLEGRKETFESRRIRRDWGPTRPTLGGGTNDTRRGQKK
ncbi:OadG family transporter subunit [Tropicimonas sp.]|uniref:OadG family transporter subunit n=1 Tax=Tropicimonas sp. TaxID=2067044 RepID=UPI003A8A8D05